MSLRRKCRAGWFGLILMCVVWVAAGCGSSGGDLAGRDRPPNVGRGSGSRVGDNAAARRGAQVRIVFFGDSITQAGARPDGYVTLVRSRLRKVYPGRDIEVIAAGVSGDKVPDLQARLERDVLSKDPTHVVVFVGVNDVGQFRFASQVKQEDKDLYREGLRDIIGRIEAAGAEAILCTPAVFGDDPRSRSKENRLLDEFAELSRGVASETGIPLCDLRAAFVDHLQTHNRAGRYQGIVTVDGVHLNEQGNRLVAAQMLKVLELRENSSPSPR